ncbi:hypothetical protein CTI12_AA071280 [Artemisia annua]|uniref:Uncharacterized protein n=1 Tax=Artemisia annua TaxID=35608 RepID=A0A2U1Q4K7_ARTAN|nr:hypothetical protein CTI12_AA071280 [Artemisia annua]
MTRVVALPFHVSYKLQNPQAIRIILGQLGRDAAGKETDDPFQGYAFEIFLPERLFNVQDAKKHHTSWLWKIRIPKKNGECTQTVGGNLLFFTRRIYANRPSGAPHRIMSLLQHTKANLEDFADNYIDVC